MLEGRSGNKRGCILQVNWKSQTRHSLNKFSPMQYGLGPGAVEEAGMRVWSVFHICILVPNVVAGTKEMLKEWMSEWMNELMLWKWDWSWKPWPRYYHNCLQWFPGPRWYFLNFSDNFVFFSCPRWPSTFWPSRALTRKEQIYVCMYTQLLLV